MAAHSGRGRLVEVPRPEMAAGFNDTRRGRIAEICFELHGLADSGAGQCEFANVPLHWFTRGIFAQNVKLGPIGFDFVDDEICQTGMLAGHYTTSGAVLGRNVNLEAVELQPAEMNRTAKQEAESVAFHRQV